MRFGKKTAELPRSSGSENDKRRQGLLSHDDLYYVNEFKRYENHLIEGLQEICGRAFNAAEKKELAVPIRYFEYLTNQFILFDRNYLAASQVELLYRIFFEDLPMIIQRTLHKAIEIREYYEAFILEGEVIETPIDAFQGWLTSCQTEYAKHLVFASSRRLQEISEKSPEELVAPPTLKLPSFQSQSVTLSDEYTSLSLLWVKATSHRNSVEDQFFLDRMATDYLPEVLEVYSAFDTASEEEKANADAMLLTYLTTLRRKLFTILATVMGNSLSLLNVEVNFIQTKIGLDESTSGLSLSKL